MDVTVSMVTVARGPHRPRVAVATPASSSGLRRNTMNLYTNTTNFSVPVHTHTPNTSAVGIKTRISRIGTAIAHIPFPDSAPTPARHISDEWSRPSLDVRMGHCASETTITSTRGDEAATPSAVPFTSDGSRSNVASSLAARRSSARASHALFPITTESNSNVAPPTVFQRSTYLPLSLPLPLSPPHSPLPVPSLASPLSPRRPSLTLPLSPPVSPFLFPSPPHSPRLTASSASPLSVSISASQPPSILSLAATPVTTTPAPLQPQAPPRPRPPSEALSFLDRARPSGKRVDAPWCSLISAEEGLYLDVVILDGVSITRSRLAEVYGFHLGLEERYLAYVRAVDRMVCLRMNDNLGEYVAQALRESREVLDTISAFVTALSPCETESSPIVASLRLASTLHQWTRVAHLTSRPTGPLPPLVFDVRDKLDEVAKIMRDPDEVQRRISLPRL